MYIRYNTSSIKIDISPINGRMAVNIMPKRKTNIYLKKKRRRIVGNNGFFLFW